MRVRRTLLPLGVVVTFAAGADEAFAQASAARVRGTPGAMRVEARPCSAHPAADLRRRIVEIAVREWEFFGFRVAPAPEG
ncbi:MAG: hypothetical protein FJW14_18745, partial [Acidimicrobiia bacterium]|nr:hypothetical protein [Acidimicrobiia bacterium]